MLEARSRGAEVFPICAVDLKARGLDLGRIIGAPGGRLTGLGQVTHVTPAGAFSEIRYGTAMDSIGLNAVACSVGFSDPGRELIDTLDTYDPRNSAARIDWAAPHLVPEDWEPLFRGVLADWSREGAVTRLMLKTDDAVLRTPVPAGTILRTEWGAAYDGTVFGTASPLLLGILDSFQITARGMVPLVNLRYDKDLGYWYGVSAGRMLKVDRVYLDGNPQGAAGWQVISGVYGGTLWTIVTFDADAKPEKEVIVSIDCHGPNGAGGGDGDTLTGVPDQLRAILQEFAYRRPPLAGWRGPVDIIGAASWDAASEYFALHRFECGKRFGADQEAQTAADLIRTYLDAHRWARLYWSPLGTLEHAIVDPDDVEPDPAAFVDLDLHHQGGAVPYEPGDDSEVATHVRTPFLYSPAEQKFMNAYEAHDIAALPEKVELVVEQPWSQARYTQDIADLNPPPPADPPTP